MHPLWKASHTVEQWICGTADQKERDTNLLKEIENIEVRSVREGRWLGFLAYISCLFFSGYMYLAGSEHLAYVAFSAAAVAVGIIVQLIRGGKSGVSIISNPPHDDVPSTPRNAEIKENEVAENK